MIYYLILIHLILVGLIGLVIYLIKAVFDYQDLVDDFMNSISTNEKELDSALSYISRLAKMPLMSDTPEIKRMVEEMKRSKKAIESLKDNLNEMRGNEKDEGEKIEY